MLLLPIGKTRSYISSMSIVMHKLHNCILVCMLCVDFVGIRYDSLSGNNPGNDSIASGIYSVLWLYAKGHDIQSMFAFVLGTRARGICNNSFPGRVVLHSQY